MKRKKTIAFITFILLLSFCSKAQNTPSFYPFKGFHVGVTGQAQFIQKSTFIALIGPDPVPRARWTHGWEAGIEFSYHFAKYFGISVGINYGTVLSYNRDVFMTAYFNFEGEWEEKYEYDPSPASMQDNEILFPIKLEFHFPLRKDLFFMAEAGVKIMGISNRKIYGKDGKGFYQTGYSITSPDDYDPETDTYHSKPYYNDWGVRDLSRIYCDLLLGIGLYYKLPYGDLLRFSCGVNVAFNNILEGYYKYHLSESYGTFAVKNDFIYTQLSYIHTFNFQKAKRYLKKNEYSFASRKERRGKIFEMLKAW